MTLMGLLSTELHGRLRACGAVLFSVMAVSSSAAMAPVSTVAIRAGDLAPVPARAPEQWGCRLSAAPSGGVVFVDRQKTALFLKEGEAVRAVAHVGDRVPGGTLAELCEAAVAQDGAIVFRALLADAPGGTRRMGIYRLPGGGGSFEALLASGQAVNLPGGPAIVGSLSGPAVDGAGRAVVSVDFVTAISALLRISPGATPEILVQSGDPLGGGVFQRSLTAPAAGRDGTVVFTAALMSGSELVAALAPGGSPVVLFQAVAAPGQPGPSVSIAPPAVNAAGQVAFLWEEGGEVRLQRVSSSGVSETIAEPGSSAPGSGTFVEITDLPPALAPDGGVVFGAYRSNDLGGIYLHRDAPVPVAEEGGDAGGAETFAAFDLYQPQASPDVASDGAILFAAADTLGEALFARAGGLLRTVLRSGEPLPLAARFVSFIEPVLPSFPFLGGGPFLAAGGRMIFDARLTTGVRGLFLRDRDGRLSAAVVAGDAAPGGGHLDGQHLSFHTVNDSGRFAFVGAAPDTAAGISLVLYYGGGDAGPLRRIIGVGDDIPGSSGRVTGLRPPSRVNARGELAVPVFTGENTVVLFGYDGTDLFRVAGPGDALPGGGSMRTIFTGSPQAGLLLPPLLDDAGVVTFGVIAADGTGALYEAALRAGGVAAARRILGDGDHVEGGSLTPFEVQSFDRDAQGGLALQAVFDPGRLFGTFLEENGALALVARRPDAVGGLGTVHLVRARLALAGEGGLVHGALLSDGTDILLLREPPPPPGMPAARGARLEQDGEPVTTVLAATGQPAPDGGNYLYFQPGSRTTARLASGRGGLLAIAAATDAGPQEIVLIDLDPNTPPAGDAGAGQEVECAGPAGTQVTLDGRLSSDPDGDLLTYLWTGPFGTATGPQPTVTLPLGVSRITLVVSDAETESPPDTVVIEVRDTVSPRIAVRAVPERIWPPNGLFVPVLFVITVSDTCDPRPRVALASVTINDPKGADPATEIADATIGSDDRIMALRARRSGGPGGRTYIVTYRATDASGNSTPGSTSVLVPQSQGN